MKQLRRLGLWSAVVTYVLIVMGAIVRVSGSGLGCPDWPTCYGSWIPPLERAALIEYTHRTLAAVVGVMVVWLVATAWRRRAAHPWAFRLGLVALVLLAIQAWLGRIVVLTELDPVMVTVHLGTAMLLLGILMAIWQLPSDGLWRWAWPNGLLAGAAAGVFAVILVGAWVRGLGAGLAFPDWPLMAGTALPALGGSAARTAQFLHRVTVLAVFGYLVYLTVVLWGRRWGRSTAVLLGVYLAQGIIGGMTVLTLLAPVVRVVHVALGALVWAVAAGVMLASARDVLATRTRFSDSLPTAIGMADE
ncbi:MAG: heme A synthase [Acidimicrobiia bacterium]